MAKDKICNKILDDKRTDEGNKFKLSTGGRQRSINLNQNSFEYDEARQIELAIAQKRKCKSQQEFNLLQKGKRDLFGSKNTVSNKLIQDKLNSRVNGWHQQVAAWMPYKMKKVDDLNYTQQKFIKKGVCNTCDNDSLVELNHLDNNGQSCSQLKPDQSVRVLNKKLQKLQTVAFVDSKEKNKDITDYIKDIIKHRKWKTEDVILKLGMDEGQGSLKIMLQVLTEKYINDCIENDLPVNSIDTLKLIIYQPVLSVVKD